MATEEELLEAQIRKTEAEANLAIGQLWKLRSPWHFALDLLKYPLALLAVVLTGFAFFGPIKETVLLENRLAAINAEIAERNNALLEQQLDERQTELDEQKRQLEIQKQWYEERLAQFAEDLKQANQASVAAIARSEELARREKDLAGKYARLASRVQDNAELMAQADAAEERAEQLEDEIISLRTQFQSAKAIAADVQTRVDVRALNAYWIRVHTGLGSAIPVTVLHRLEELGLTYDNIVYCPGAETGVYYLQEHAEPAAKLLAEALHDVVPGIEPIFHSQDAAGGPLFHSGNTSESYLIVCSFP